MQKKNCILPNFQSISENQGIVLQTLNFSCELPATSGTFFTLPIIKNRKKIFWHILLHIPSTVKTDKLPSTVKT